MSQTPRMQVPDELSEAFARSPIAGAAFEALPPTHQRRYAEAVARAGGAGERAAASTRVVDEILATKQQP